MGNGNGKPAAMDPATKAFYDKLESLLGNGGGGSAAALYGGSSVPQGASAPDPQLYFGGTFGRTATPAGGTMKFGVVDGENITGPNRQRVPNIMTLSEAQMQWYKWTQAERLAWTKRAYALGYLQSPTDVQNGMQIYMQALDQSVRYFGVKKNVSPWDVLDLNAGSNADTLKKRGMINKDGSITQTNSQINLSDKASVEALATQVLQQALGRDPTQSEINTYYNTIRGQEQAHPTVTKTTTNQATGSSTSTTTGGFGADDASEMLKQQIQNDPEYAKYQAGTTYYAAALQALGAIGGA